MQQLVKIDCLEVICSFRERERPRRTLLEIGRNDLRHLI